MDRLQCYVFVLFLLATPAIAQKKTDPHQAKDKTPFVPKLETRPNLPSEETVNAFLKEMFGYDSQLSWKIADIRPSEAEGLAQVTIVMSSPKGQELSRFYVTADGKHALAGQLMPFGTDPFGAERKLLAKEANGPSRGPATAPVTVVEFSDLQCPHCKAAVPVLDKLLGEETNVRFVFENFPLPMHDWAAKAAAYADCVGRASKDAFWKFVQGTFDAQGEITAANADQKLTAVADAAGVKGSDIASCAAKPETEARVQQSVELGKSVRVTGTPALFINGREIENLGGLPYDVLKNLVDFAAKDAANQPATSAAVNHSN
jgi:protein-disulfide isomerase